MLLASREENGFTFSVGDSGGVRKILGIRQFQAARILDIVSNHGERERQVRLVLREGE